MLKFSLYNGSFITPQQDHYCRWLFWATRSIIPKKRMLFRKETCHAQNEKPMMWIFACCCWCICPATSFLLSSTSKFKPVLWLASLALRCTWTPSGPPGLVSVRTSWAECDVLGCRSEPDEIRWRLFTALDSLQPGARLRVAYQHVRSCLLVWCLCPAQDTRTTQHLG